MGARTPERNHEKLIPALGFDRLTPLFDPLLRLTLPERRFKAELLRQAGIRDGHTVVDLGCGTGTLALMIRRSHPAAAVIGIDADENILAIAAGKAKAARERVAFRRESAERLSLADASVDRALSSLFFHHLSTEAKAKALKEAFRVLRPGGELHIADWGRPHGLGMRLAFCSVQLLDGFETTADSVAGRLPALMAEAGFAGVKEGPRFRTIFGTLALYSGKKT